MKLNHLNLAVDDVAAAKTFLMTCFGLRDMAAGDNNKNRAFLQDDGGMVISMFKGKDIHYPGTFHIGFIQESEAAVDAIYARMTADGLKADPAQRSHRWTFYVKAPGGFLVEVLA
jgi:lactoylglutathione lyase